MNDQLAVTCSLCDRPALLNSKPNFGRYIALECSTCGQFVVSDAADERVRGLPIEFKDKWRALIRSAAPDQILLIITQPVGSGGGLKDELVPRSSLRL